MDAEAEMLGRARELNPTYSMALNHYANHLFWLWQDTTLAGYVQPGRQNVFCSINPTELIKVGTSIELVHNHVAGSIIETQVLEISSQPNENGDWAIKLAAEYTSCVESGLHQIIIRVKEVPEIDDLASRAYHCGLLCPSIHLYGNAISGTAVPEIRAEAYFILGRNRHTRGDAKAALPYYAHACKLWPHFALAQYRLAQVMLSTPNAWREFKPTNI